MNQSINHIVVIGGGSAGWITAGLIAAKYKTSNNFKVSLIRSPDIPSVGVGEGTWPSMRGTLQKLGISEQTFLTACDASFKQGSEFIDWQKGQGEHYFHPFTLPQGINQLNLAQYWLAFKDEIDFAHAVCPQASICEQYKAPKLITTPEYLALANYGYHLDANKFGMLLEQHCTKELGVQLFIDHLNDVESNEHGDVVAVLGQKHGRIKGDLFVDCSGMNAFLFQQHFQIPFISLKPYLFNDSALAVRVPYENDQTEFASHTRSTAKANGWIWDIALPTRRGVGFTYSSSHANRDEIEQQLIDYITQDTSEYTLSKQSIKHIHFEPGHRQTFWHKNCVAIGMAAGFIEPLEASALALIELSASMLAEQMPSNRAMVDIVAKRFNRKFAQRWQQITEFLKLHYAISKRQDSDYWRDHQSASSMPESLQEKLSLWQYQPPYSYDTEYTEELFPFASYQYVLYGMGFETQYDIGKLRSPEMQQAQRYFQENQKNIKKLLGILPSNRTLFNKIQQYGFSKI